MRSGGADVKQCHEDPAFAWLRNALAASPVAGQCSPEQSAWALREGLGPLLARHFSPVRELQHSARQLAMREMAHQSVLSRLAQACSELELSVLVIKGEALARTIYSDAATRDRSDIDLWVHPRQLDALTVALGQLGIPAIHNVRQRWARFEVVHARAEPPSVVFDVHIHPFFRPRLFPEECFDFVWERSAVLPELAPLRTPARDTAFLIAALHLAKNTHKRAIWLYDLHLLALADPDAVLRACEQAVSWRLASLVSDAMKRCFNVFGTPFPCALPIPVADEVSARMLHESTRWSALKRDFKLIPEWRERLRFVGELLLRPN